MMNQQTLSLDSTSISGPNCSTRIKHEPEDDFEQIGDNQFTDGSDMKEIDMPIINITPIVTDQINMYKIEDTPKVKLEPNDVDYPSYEPSHQSIMKQENDSTVECPVIVKEEPSSAINNNQNDDSTDPLIEVYGNIDCKDSKPDDCNAIDQLRVGTMIQSDVGQKDATKEPTAGDLESRCGNTVEDNPTGVESCTSMSSEETVADCEPEPEVNRCSTCGESFKCRSYLVIHTRSHTGEKPYPCSTCDKSFRYKCDLVRHNRVHTGEKPYSCSTCGESFRIRRQLIIHKGIHTGEKPYTCAKCGKSFSGQGSLTKHEHIHTRWRDALLMNHMY